MYTKTRVDRKRHFPTWYFSKYSLSSYLLLSPSYLPVSPSLPLSISISISLSFILSESGTWNLIFGLKNTYTGTVLDVLSEDSERNAFWLVLLFG